MYEKYLIVGGALCLVVALAEAWLLVATTPKGDGRATPLAIDRQDLVRSHIDYLMMAQFQFIFFALNKTLGVAAPAWIVACVCLGAFFNPLAFLLRALRPAWREAPPAAFTATISTSCVLTTIGFAAMAWRFVSAVL